jgi:Tol biopolymer transport system component
MNEERLKELLRETPVPEERQAEERGWRVVKAAYRSPASARRRHPWRLVAAFSVAAIALAIGLSPAGAKVAELLHKVTAPAGTNTTPALTSLPAPGRLLVTSSNGAWVVAEDGSMRFLGHYSDATWSPHGLFVAASANRQLTALTPEGTPHWSISGSGRVRDPRWSPSGYRVAYRSGNGLRIIAGDGTGDRLLANQVASVAPAWRPASPSELKASPNGLGTHVLAFATRGGRIEVVDVDSGRVLWRSAPGARPSSLQWSPDGKRLLALDQNGWRLFAAGGRQISEHRERGPGSPVAAAFSPRGNELALVVANAHGPREHSQVFLVNPQSPSSSGEKLVGLPGRVNSPTWSPNSQWLLLAWKDADQWLFMRPTASASRQHIKAISKVSRLFSPGSGSGPFPEPQGWCCNR